MKIDENQLLKATLEEIGRYGTPHLGYESTTSIIRQWGADFFGRDEY